MKPQQPRIGHSTGSDMEPSSDYAIHDAISALQAAVRQHEKKALSNDDDEIYAIAINGLNSALDGSFTDIEHSQAGINYLRSQILILNKNGDLDDETRFIASCNATTEIIKQRTAASQQMPIPRDPRIRPPST